MKCKKCGNEIAAGKLFCDNCGTKVELPTPPKSQKHIEHITPEQKTHNIALEHKKRKKVRVIGIIAVSLVFVCGLLGVLTLIFGNPINAIEGKVKNMSSGRGKATTEATTEVTTEVTTQTTTEATTEKAAAVPYMEEKNVKFLDSDETMSNPAYIFPAGEGGFFDAIESSDLFINSSELKISISNVDISDPDEDGYVTTRLYYNIVVPIEFIMNGFEGYWNPQVYATRLGIADYNTGMVCSYNSLDTDTTVESSEYNYLSIATFGDAELKDDDFYKENMLYTDLEFDGTKYNVGAVDSLISVNTTDAELIASTDIGDKYYREAEYQRLLVIYAPEDCKEFLYLDKKGLTKSDYFKELETHVITLTEEASETDSTEEDSATKSKPLGSGKDDSLDNYLFMDPTKTGDGSPS
ncbi:hypothetical protein SAMN02910369_02640 [Lachnospiraceae bacterium NE2001]|nr:hypothetical protein SAMN02910369_02640 [Lachnospiraceae bacterium NE2001]